MYGYIIVQFKGNITLALLSTCNPRELCTLYFHFNLTLQVVHKCQVVYHSRRTFTHLSIIHCFSLELRLIPTASSSKYQQLLFLPRIIDDWYIPAVLASSLTRQRLLALSYCIRSIPFEIRYGTAQMQCCVCTSTIVRMLQIIYTHI